MTYRFSYLPCAAAIMLAACGEPEPAPSALLAIDEASPSALGPAEQASPSQASPSYAATPKPGEELPTSQTTPGPIPLAFRHVWAIEPADCKAAPGLTRIAIAPGAIKSYEGRSEVVSAKAPPEGPITLQVSHSAEGETITETHTLALDETGTELTYQRGGSTFTYQRCD